MFAAQQSAWSEAPTSAPRSSGLPRPSRSQITDHSNAGVTTVAIVLNRCVGIIPREHTCTRLHAQRCRLPIVYIEARRAFIILARTPHRLVPGHTAIPTVPNPCKRPSHEQEGSEVRFPEWSPACGAVAEAEHGGAVVHGRVRSAGFAEERGALRGVAFLWRRYGVEKLPGIAPRSDRDSLCNHVILVPRRLYFDNVILA